MDAVMERLRPLAWLLFAVMFAFVLPEARAQRADGAEATEASVKAAFLYKFAGYVDWPPSAFASPDAPFVFAVTGSDEVANELARVAAGRNIEGHPVVVRRLRENEPARGVHVLFVARGSVDRQAVIARAGQQPGVLVVTETERGLEAGSAINFVHAEDRVGFEVSVDAAERSGLKISSRMLAVARRVLAKGS
jgi:hypothetical protein